LTIFFSFANASRGVQNIHCLQSLHHKSIFAVRIF